MARQQIGQFMAAMRSVESGGNYRAIGPSTRYGTAKGAYQFLDSTWAGYGGYRRASDAPPHVQDQRAAQLMKQYYSQFGSWPLVAVAWHGGPGAAQRAARTGRITGADVNMSTQNYVNTVMSAMGQGGGGQGMGQGYGTGAFASQGASGGGTFMQDFGFYEMSEEEAKAKAKALYGYLGWYVDHPEVGPVLIQGAKEGWAAERLKGALVKTQWWQKTSESQRQFGALLTSDPATAKRRLNETGLSIRQKAASLGIWGMGHNRWFQLTVQAVANQWTDEEMQLALASEMRWRRGASEQGEIGRMMQSVRQMANEYMIPVTKKQEWRWVRRMVSGAASPEAVQASFQKLAKSRFPHLKDEIDAGVTPGQFFAPYRNAIAQTLEVSPETIDLMDPEWSDVTSFRDSKMSKVRPMTISEATLKARRRPEWTHTDNARKQIANTASSLSGMLGLG